MISLYGRQKKQSFSEYMSSLNIVPVSITYEYDPNDLAKANELYEKEKNASIIRSPLARVFIRFL